MNVPEPVAQIEAALTRFADSLRLPANLADAVRYALLSGGKRIRPLLAWHACAACGSPGEASLPAGVAVELVHAFSLVHDDLPALDNDDLRRGKPTLHKHAGEAMAILAGDALLTLAFDSVLGSSLESDLARRLAGELSAGTSSMIAGQVYDTLGGLDPALGPVARLRTIHTNKTGALIRASVRMGALCGLVADGERDDHDASLSALTDYADAVGLIFQISDDLLDVEQSAKTTGKRTGKDRELGKTTYPGVLGVEASRRQIAELMAQAERAIAPLGKSAAGLRRLVELISHRQA